MSDVESQSTLQRPDDKLIARFGLWQVGENTIRTYLEKAYSLGICCRNCRRTIEWTPPELLKRFGHQLDLPLKELVPNLACTGEEGCGVKDVAVFPHLYDQAWIWAPKPWVAA